VAIVEDEAKIAELLRDYLQQSSIASQLIANGAVAVQQIRESRPDVVLLDLMLPGKDGMTICREIREFSQVPIIMVTARVEEIDRLLGLELGADDYVCKPFSPREVVARVKAQLRRLEFQSREEEGYRGLVIDDSQFRATLDACPLDLTPVEFRLLALFASQPGRVYSRDQLMDRIYPDGRVVSDRTVDSHIKNLRRKLESAAGGEEMIH
jgi:two-component system response regulator BaeR